MTDKRVDSGIWPYLLLMNMGVTMWFMAQEPIERLIPGAAALAAIAVLHLLGSRGGRYTPALLGAQLALTIGLGFIYHPMYMYLIFLTLYASMKLPSRLLIAMAAVNAAAIAAMMVVSGYAGNPQMWFTMLPPVFGGCILPFIVRASERYREMAVRLQAATSEVERLAQQAERQRIAQELHDTLGHTLSLLALKGELIEKLIPRAPEKAAAEARDVRETAGAALRQMRELVSDMKVVRLAEEWEHARALCAAANVRLAIRDGLPESGILLTPLQESVIGMCVREALTNVVRHSRASACAIELTGGSDSIRCTVEDDGEGFDTAIVMGGAAAADGAGGSSAGGSLGADGSGGTGAVGSSGVGGTGGTGAVGSSGSVGTGGSGGTGGTGAVGSSGSIGTGGTGAVGSSGVGGNGTIGMKQRLALLEGTLTIHSSRGGGTKLVMDIPIVRRDGRMAGGGAG